MALSNIRPGPPALLVDDKGREMMTFPADLGRALVFLDDQLAALGLRFNLQCEHCSMAEQRPMYCIPRVEHGVLTVNCDHATRRVRLEHA